MGNKWVVWVGGVEVNNYYLSEHDARELAKEYQNLGYDDVQVEQVD